MESKLKRWRRLPSQERRFLLRAWAWLLWCDVALRLLPFRVAREWASRRRRRRIAGPPLEPSRMAQLVAAAGRNHLWRMTCLRQSLTLQRLLGGYGIDSTLRIGVRKTGSQLHAHAWLESEGEILEPSPEGPDFVALEPASALASESDRPASPPA